MKEINMEFLNYSTIKMKTLIEISKPDRLLTIKEVFEVFTKREAESAQDAFTNFCQLCNIEKNSKNHPFVKIVKENNYTLIDKYISYITMGFNPNCSDFYGKTAAHVLAETGNIELFKKLRSFLNWEKEDSFGNRPIHIAVLSHQIEMIKALIELRINLESRNKMFLTPSKIAEFEKNEEIIDLLKNNNAMQIFD